MPAPLLDVHDDAAAAALAVARLVAAEARAAVAARGRFVCAFSGGDTPTRMLADLAAQDLPWAEVQVLQVDERLAPDGSSARNATALAAALAGTGLPPANLHPMPVTPEDEEAAIDVYEARLTLLAGSPPMLDLVHLGLGEDGHVASLMPGDGLLRQRRRDVGLSAAEYGGWRRMTLTLPALARARRRVWLVTGEHKREALRRLLAGDQDIPAGQLPGADAVVVADRAAAGR